MLNSNEINEFIKQTFDDDFEDFDLDKFIEATINKKYKEIEEIYKKKELELTNSF